MCKVLSVFVSKSHFLVFYIYGQGYTDDTDTTDFGVVSSEPLKNMSLMFFYITAQSRQSCWTCFSISLRAFTYPLPSVRSWNKFRMTFGVIYYLNSHFEEANSILMSNLITRNSSFIAHCQTFLLLSTNQTLVSKWTKIA